MKRPPFAVLAAGLCVFTGLAVSAGVSATSEPPDATTPTSEPAETTPGLDPPAGSEPGTSVEEAPVVTTADTTTTLPAWDPAPIEWTELEPGIEEGWLEVPIDYANPADGTFRLYLVRNLADDPAARIGSLLVNPGGPGFGGAIFGEFASQVYGDRLLDSFDIVGWDPRGTGESEPAIDCIDDYDEFYAGYDITPDDESERQQIIDLAEDFATECTEKNAEIIEHIGTNNSARDMDAIRRALGEDQISYFGFSYGSELGATWATLFPDTVRAAVLDGASDPNADLVEGSLQQVQGFEGTLSTYLAQCSEDPSCPFGNGGDAEGAFDRLMLKLDEKPIPSEPGRPEISRGVALQAVAEAMYSESTWVELSAALAAAEQGDGSGLLALWDAYYQRLPDGTWDNSIEAFQTIVCMDSSDRPTVEEEDATAPMFQDVAPRFAPNTTGSYFCTFYPESIDPRVEITGAGAGPIVVCGATGDAATPLASTRNMASALEDGRLVVIQADQHTCYGADQCADQIIEDYLVDLAVPAEETACPGVTESTVA